MDLDLIPASELFSKSKIQLASQIQVGGGLYSVEAIIAKLEPLLLEERVEKIQKVVGKRSLKVMTVLEDIYDRGNVSAVMRTAESLGFFRFLILEKENAKFKAANRITRGAEKWLDVKVSSKLSESVQSLKAEGYQLVGTDLNATHELSEVPLDQPVALVIGNEKDGISEEMKSLVDIRVKIPMVGFSQSYNLSVASAMCLYEFSRHSNPDQGMSEEERKQLYANYLLRGFDNPERLLKN